MFGTSKVVVTCCYCRSVESKSVLNGHILLQGDTLIYSYPAPDHKVVMYHKKRTYFFHLNNANWYRTGNHLQPLMSFSVHCTFLLLGS